MHIFGATNPLLFTDFFNFYLKVSAIISIKIMLWNYVEVEEELHFARPSLLNGITTQFVYPVITNVEYYCGGGTTLHIAARVNF